MRKEIRIGISMRITDAVNYKEQRDTIASDWSTYLLSEFPDCQWILIPNMGEKVVDYFHQWNLNVLILTGGDDIGRYPIRDITEFALLKMAIENKIPVIGICRGMQLIHHFYDGKLLSGDNQFDEIHRSKEHCVLLKGHRYMTNSFHSNQIDENSLHNDFEILATCENDATIEAFEKQGVLGIMWHPERSIPYQKWNTELIREFIEKYGK